MSIRKWRGLLNGLSVPSAEAAGYADRSDTERLNWLARHPGYYLHHDVARDWWEVRQSSSGWTIHGGSTARLAIDHAMTPGWPSA